jgi:hypothetical protein
MQSWCIPDLLHPKQQIPCGNDRKKGKDKNKSRFFAFGSE